jgi:hypothetical protein
MYEMHVTTMDETATSLDIPPHRVFVEKDAITVWSFPLSMRQPSKPAFKPLTTAPIALMGEHQKNIVPPNRCKKYQPNIKGNIER